MSSKWVSKDQFKDLATEVNTIPPGKSESGFSVSARQGPDGEIVRAADRYMVGGTPGQITESLDAPISGRNLASFTRKNKGLLSQPEHYLGSWHEADRQPAAQVDLDVSQGFPRTEAGGVKARSATLTRNERAHGDINKAGGYAGSVTNPFSTRPLSDEKPVSSYMSSLRSNPAAYASVISGDVLGGMSMWVNGRAVQRSKSG